MAETVCIRAVVYKVSHRDSNERGFELMEYDSNAPCEACGLRVGSASMGGTAVCPTCDCGRKRKGAMPRDRSRKLNPWANRTKSTYFPLNEELAAYRRLVEVDPSPINKELLKLKEERLSHPDSSVVIW